MNKKKLLKKILNNQRNVRFEDFCLIMEAFGFVLVRIRGSHHQYKNVEIGITLAVQPQDGKAKEYQVIQFLKLVHEHNLTLEN